MKINNDNWTSSHYFSDPLRAFVSLGAQPSGENDVEIHYLVTVADTDYLEVYQSMHFDLESALAVLNEKYGHWDVKDAGVKASGDGCSSCAAH